ncbi:MAG: response regulator transcription factor [Acidobacteria bacterium]|nr:response regulator transcription factor [Acidobacteriota bacterium]
MRLGLRQVLTTDPRIKIVAETTDGAAALAQVRALRPHIALLDVKMKPLSGFEVARAIRAEALPSAIIFLTQYDDEQHFNAALDLGVNGYVLKDDAQTEVLHSIHAVAAGQPYITPTLSGFMLKRATRGALTPTERRILQLIADYKTSPQIADELHLAPRTIEHHRENICAKLELKGPHALLRYALEHRDEL